MSDAVGVTKLEELGEVEKDMLLSHLSPIKANKLMKVFERFKGILNYYNEVILCKLLQHVHTK